jgi:hypothetical protein
MSGRRAHFLGGLCDVSRWSNATFCNGIGSVVLSSSKLSGTCAQWSIDWALIGSISSPHSFLSPHLGYHVNPSKNKCVITICICIKFSHYSLGYYFVFASSAFLSFFFHFSHQHFISFNFYIKLNSCFFIAIFYLFLILSLNILFRFLSNLIIILLFAIFFCFYPI